VNRSEFAQAVMSLGIKHDAHKDGQQWAIRCYDPNPGDPSAVDYVDIAVEVSKPTVATTREADLYGKSRIEGGWRVTVGGNIALRQTPWGVVEDLTEDNVVVAGSGLQNVDGWDEVTGAQEYDVVHVHRISNSGGVQEYYLYLQPASGGASRG
jgi:hypothetical protein